MFSSYYFEGLFLCSQSLTFQAWSFHVHPEQATIGSNNFFSSHFQKIFPKFWYLNIILARKSKKDVYCKFVESNQISERPTLQYLLIVLRSVGYLIIWHDFEADCKYKNAITPSETHCKHYGQTLSAFWLMKGLLKLFYLMHPGHNWGHHLL